VTIWVGQVKEPFSPTGIAWGTIRTVAGRYYRGVQGIHVGMVEDDPSPPRPLFLDGLSDEIEVAVASLEARKPSRMVTVNNFKSECSIEANGPRHIMRRQRYGADARARRRFLLALF
jgi:hypothetical protein